MLTVLFNWGYIFVTAFLIGFAVLLPFEKERGGAGAGRVPGGGTGCVRRKMTAVLMAGLAAVTVYSQVFSLFAGVGLLANVLLMAACAVIAVVWRRPLAAYWRERAGQCSRGYAVFLAGLVLLMAYGTSRGYMHVDTGLYHAQAIRWIEEYGVVPGLGNLHSRFAYNSAAFPLCAVYSMRWLGGLFPEGIHAVQGFLALLVGIQCSGIRTLAVRRRVRVSDFVRVGGIYYLTVLFGEMVSPASDYFAMLLLLFVLIDWLDLLESGEKEAAPFALLSLLLVFTVTVKLSAAVILLLVLKPAVQLLREKRWKEIGLYLGLGFGIALPWLIRGVLISGWLFYPFTFLDLFPVDWKIEKGYADCDSREIQVFARLLYDVNLYDTPFSGWAGKWFASLKGLEKLWVAASAACTGLGAVTIAGAGLSAWKAGSRQRNKGAREKETQKKEIRKKEIQKKELSKNSPESGEILPWDWILYAAVLITGYFFWQFSAPLVRYGYVYVLALPAAVPGYCYIKVLGKSEKGRRYGYYVFGAGFVLFLAFKAVGLAGGVAASAGEPYYVRQQGYGSFDAVTYDVDGVTVYVPADGGQIGYDKFPSSPRIQNIELRGEGVHAGDLRYGFRKNRKEENAK